MSGLNEYMNTNIMMERIHQIRDETRSRRFMAIAKLYYINGWRDIRFEKNKEEFKKEVEPVYEYETENEEEDDE